MIGVSTMLDRERSKYEAIWAVPEYKLHSPGLENVERFLRVADPNPGESLIDLGCGAGVAGLEFARFGLSVTWLDLTDAGLAPEFNRERFIKAALWDRNWTAGKWDYGFCCDVLEHLPPEYTLLSVDRILSACHTTWFQIALRPDEFGQTIGQSLHLTVQPYSWWLERLAAVGTVVDARDLCGNGLYVVQR